MKVKLCQCPKRRKPVDPVHEMMRLRLYERGFEVEEVRQIIMEFKKRRPKCGKRKLPL